MGLFMNKKHLDGIPVLFPLPESLTTPPDGWETGFFTNQDGARLRHGTAPATGTTRAGIVLVTGFNEVMEKYAETMRDFTAMGYKIHALDWRGQGGSDHWHADRPQRATPLDYADDVRDLEDFCQNIVKQDPDLADKKLFLMAHSMGGYIGLRHLHDYPATFDGMTTTAPMLGLKTRPFPRPVAKAIAQTMTRLGQGHRYVPGGSDWQDDCLHLAMKSLHTHDPLRGQLHHLLYRDHPEWRLGHATFRWLNTAFDSLDIIQKHGFFENISTPVIMAVAGQDHLIDPAWQQKAARAMPNTRLVTYPDARHEILHEIDSIRQDWLGQAQNFMATLENIPAALRPATAAPAVKKSI